MSGMFDLANRTALIVGGRGYLGRRFATALADAGADVHAADLAAASRASRAGDSVAADDARVQQHTLDVSDAAAIDALVRRIVDRRQRLDVMIYSVTAKPEDFYKPFTECSLEGWQQILRAELDGLYLAAQSAGRAMEASGGGSMIFLSSIYGVVGNDQRIYEGANLAQLYAGAEETQQYAHAGYAAAKGAVISLTRFLAAYWGAKNIRVNCVSPGGIQHPGENETFVRRYSARVPLGRKALPDEINGAILFLASDASSYMTGQNVIVDGGWTAW